MESINPDSVGALNSQLAKHREIRNLLPFTWNSFFSRFGHLRDVQLEVIPAILSGCDVLVTAPTAGGKTEAVMAPVCELIKSRRLSGLSCIYVTPTRALVNDLYERLENPLSQIDLRLGRRTSDHRQQNDASVIITTPESLESMLTFNKELLREVRIVVMDEIHLLDGTPRGDQLRLLLKRLRRYIRWISPTVNLTCIAITATISDPVRVSKVFLGCDSRIVNIKGQRSIDATYKQCQKQNSVADCIVEGVASLKDVRKAIVFVNRRKDVDTLVDTLNSRALRQYEIFGHHGSLGREERENIENRFRLARTAICIATMTLEIGIDIGDIDLVICVDPPPDLSSFLQRIGRGSRRLQSASRVLCCSTDPSFEIIFKAFVYNAKIGLTSAPTCPFRRSVIFQQILAYLRQTDRRRRLDGQLVELFADENVPVITEAAVRASISGMAASGYLEIKSGVVEIGIKGADFIESRSVYSNIASPLGVRVVDVDTGKMIAVVGSTKSDRINIAGRKYEVAANSTGQIIVRGTDAKIGDSPEYISVARMGWSASVGNCIARYFGIKHNEIVFSYDGLFFTWLGKFYNSIIATACNNKGFAVTATSFGLRFERLSDSKILMQAVKDAAISVCRDLNSFADPVELFFDCGAHYRLLSESDREQSRREWVDSSFLMNWQESIDVVRTVLPSDPLFSELELLARL